jgi:S1-C subfamily serine protease
MGAALWMPAGAQQLRELFRRVSPSVVVVRTIEKEVAREPQGGFVSAPGLGSGVIVTADGKVLTAAHVVQTADRVAVQLVDGRLLPAHVIGSAERADVAVLQLEQVPADLVPAKLGNSDLLDVGDAIFIIGAPYGIGHTLTAGHIGGRRSPPGLVGGNRVDLLQTDASVNEGNSGGPMFDMTGQVVGIVSHILSRSGGFEGLSFAVSSNTAQKLLLGRATFWTGADAVLLTGDAAKLLNVPQSAGLLVQHVAAGSPAAELGVRAGVVRITIAGEELLAGGDIVLDVGGIPVTADPNMFERIHGYLSALKPGDPIAVKVLRGGQVLTLSARARRL